MDDPGRAYEGRSGEHRVPLSRAALSVIRKMTAIRLSEHVFPGASVDRPLSNMALLTVLRLSLIHI